MAQDAKEVTSTSMRLPRATLRRVDRYVARRNAEGNGARVSRNTAFVLLLDMALDTALADEEQAPLRSKKIAGRR